MNVANYFKDDIHVKLYLVTCIAKIYLVTCKAKVYLVTCIAKVYLVTCIAKVYLVTCIAKVSEQLMVMSLTVSQPFPLIMPNNNLF